MQIGDRCTWLRLLAMKTFYGNLFLFEMIFLSLKLTVSGVKGTLMNVAN